MGEEGPAATWNRAPSIWRPLQPSSHPAIHPPCIVAAWTSQTRPEHHVSAGLPRFDRTGRQENSSYGGNGWLPNLRLTYRRALSDSAMEASHQYSPSGRRKRTCPAANHVHGTHDIPSQVSPLSRPLRPRPRPPSQGCVLSISLGARIRCVQRRIADAKGPAKHMPQRVPIVGRPAWIVWDCSGVSQPIARSILSQ